MQKRTYTSGVRFRQGFNRTMPARQAGIDRYVYNKLLEIFREEYRRTGMVNTPRARINGWYTDMRNNAGPGWLKRSVSGITRETLYDLGKHYKQYVDTEYLKAAGVKPQTEWGEPHFKRYGDPISIPLRITHDNTDGNARFTDDRTVRIHKMGDVKLSRAFPVQHDCRAKVARLFQTADGKWRITMASEVPDDPKPYWGEPVLLGIDHNIGNAATPDFVIVPPDKVVRRMLNAEKTASRAQHIASRRQKPDHANHKPGSKRWRKAQNRAARNKRPAADIRHTVAHRASHVMSKVATHAVVENLNLKAMTKSAKGTKENPGKNVKQKSGLSKSILQQCWGLLVALLMYKMIGGVLRVPAPYTSQTCSRCGFVDACNRIGREFLCLLCWYELHADRNAAKNIENKGERKMGKPCLRGNILVPLNRYPAEQAGNAHVKGRLDVEGSSVSAPAKRQAQTGSGRPSRTVVLWDDV